MRQRPFFDLHQNLEAKFRAEIELSGLTKLRKKHFAPSEFPELTKNRRLCTRLFPSTILA